MKKLTLLLALVLLFVAPSTFGDSPKVTFQMSLAPNDIALGSSVHVEGSIGNNQNQPLEYRYVEVAFEAPCDFYDVPWTTRSPVTIAPSGTFGFAFDFTPICADTYVVDLIVRPIHGNVPQEVVTLGLVVR